MWELWREEMRGWGDARWTEWFAEHARRDQTSSDESRDVHRSDDRDAKRAMLRRWDEKRETGRAAIQALPAVALRQHAELTHPHRTGVPRCVGIGAAGDLMAVWQDDGEAADVARFAPDGSLESTMQVERGARVWGVHPLTDERWLFTWNDGRHPMHADVRAGTGEVVHRGSIGDASRVLATAADALWAGYGDEAIFGAGAPGLARFAPDLTRTWRYPSQVDRKELPPMLDGDALSVDGEVAWVSAYEGFRLLSVVGDDVQDHGELPVSGAHGVLVDGDRSVSLGSWEGELVTPLSLTPAGIRLAGPQRRLTYPDGTAVHQAHRTCRGRELHVVLGSTWYRTDLDALWL